jgi:beta-galactosidase
VGRPQYIAPGEPEPSHVVPYPYLVAGCGDIDITGHRRPASYYREIVLGLRAEPYIAVRRPEHHGKTWAGSQWAWSDAIVGWTWPGYEGEPITVEVYSGGDEVELPLGGESLGRRSVGV